MATEFTNSASASFMAGTTNLHVTSNYVTATASEGTITLTKTQSSDTLFPSTVQQYTITGVSTLTIGATLFTLTDVIPAGLTLLPSSFKVDGVDKVPSLVGNTLSYIFGAWAAGATHTFSFQCMRS